VIKAMKSNPWGIKKPEIWGSYSALLAFAQRRFCVLGAELNHELDRELPDRSVPLRLRGADRKKVGRLTRIGTVTAEAPAAALGGKVLVTTMDKAAEVVGQSSNQVTRLDLNLQPGYDLERTREKVQDRLAELGSPAMVQTPEEKFRTSIKAMEGMQTGFTLSG